MFKPKENDQIQVQYPQIAIYPSVYVAMMRLVDLALPNEISGLGTVSVKNGVLVVDHIIYEGDAHDLAATDITKQMSIFTNKLVNEGRAKELGKIHVWWHSHCEGQVFWSPTDEGTMCRCTTDKDGCVTGGITGEYLISMVVNTHQDMRCRYVNFDPVITFFDDLPVKFYLGDDDHTTPADAIKQVEELWKQLHPARKRSFFSSVFSSQEEEQPKIESMIPAPVIVDKLPVEAMQALTDSRQPKSDILESKATPMPAPAPITEPVQAEAKDQSETTAPATASLAQESQELEQAAEEAMVALDKEAKQPAEVK